MGMLTALSDYELRAKSNATKRLIGEPTQNVFSRSDSRPGSLRMTQ